MPLHNLDTVERRKNHRIPARMALKCRNNDGAIFKVYSVDITPFGVQIESDTSLPESKKIELWPAESSETDDTVVKGEIRWINRAGNKFRSGIAFANPAHWPEVFTSGEADEPNIAVDILNSILRGVDDGVLIVDGNMNIIAANPSQPFCPGINHSNLPGCSLRNVSSFLEVDTPEGKMMEILQTVLETGEEKRLCSRCGTGAMYGMYHNYNIWIKRITTPAGTPGLMIRARKSDAQLSTDTLSGTEQDENLLLKYNYVTLGQLFDGLIEDIVNPISAAVGRLDLMAIKLESDQSNEIDRETLQHEVKSIQNILMQVTEFCRAAIRRRKDNSGTTKHFSLNALIEDELRTLDLHTQFKSISKELNLDREIPLIEGNYSDWVNAFVSLCQAIMRRISTLQHKRLSITTSFEDGFNVMKFTHNGKALAMPLETDPSLTIFKLLKAKYGIMVTAQGTSGNQTLEFRIRPASEKAING